MSFCVKSGAENTRATFDRLQQRFLIFVGSLYCAFFCTGCSTDLFYQPQPYTSSYHFSQMRSNRIQQIGYWIKGEKQVAYFFLPRNDSTESITSVWLLIGGIRSLALDWCKWFDGENSSTAFILVDYPGYGHNEGTPRDDAIHASIQKAFNRALKVYSDLLHPDFTVGVLGHSLGTGIASYFAGNNRVDQLVLIAPFTNLDELTRYRYGYALGIFLNSINPEEYDNESNINRYMKNNPTSSITLFHGTLDKIIPVTMSRELQRQHPEKILLIEFPELGHRNLFAERIGIIKKRTGMTD